MTTPNFDFILLLTVDDLPSPSFQLNATSRVFDRALFLVAIQRECQTPQRQPRARYGALADDVQRLIAIVLANADSEQSRSVRSVPQRLKRRRPS